MTATDKQHGLSSASIETLAGLTAGLVSTVIVHPLDIIKTRLQLDTSSHPLLNSSRNVFRDILRNEGPTRVAALYRGLTPNLVGNSSGWALYFLFYSEAQNIVRHTFGKQDTSIRLSSFEYLLASAGAGFVSAILTNPIWVIKTRMLSTSADTHGAYPSMISGLRSIYRTEGVRGYFHGLVPTLFGVTHGALYFMAYEKLKVWRQKDATDKAPSNMDTLVNSSLSKVFAGSLTYPHQVVRARMQTYNPSAPVTGYVKGPGLVGFIQQIWRTEGLLGFYKGLGPNLFRVLPSTCVTFLVYENMKSFLAQQRDDKLEGIRGGSGTSAVQSTERVKKEEAL